VSDGRQHEAATHCLSSPSSSSVAVGGTSGPLLLTGGLLVRIQPEEPHPEELLCNGLRDSQLALSNFHRRCSPI